MMIAPFHPDHLASMLLQPAQAGVQPLLGDPAYGASLAQAGPCYSAVVDGVVIACAGLIPQWQGRAVAWALISNAAGPHFLGVHRAVRRALQVHDFRRVETGVVVDFEEGHRWAKMLGFEREGRMRAYTPDGRDCDLYARVREEH
jgi:ribosomal protein S18 acetylase RimI-like enzyme